MKKLNEKQKKFAFLLSMGYKHARAYREAGYSSKGAKVSAHKLLKNPAIREHWNFIIDETHKLIEKQNRERAKNRRQLYGKLENHTS